MEWSEWAELHLGFRPRLHPFASITEVVLLSGANVVARMETLRMVPDRTGVTFHLKPATVLVSGIVTEFEMRDRNGKVLLVGTVTGPLGSGAMRLSTGHSLAQVFSGQVLTITHMRFQFA